MGIHFFYGVDFIIFYLKKNDLLDTTPYWHLLAKGAVIFASFTLSVWENYISCKNIKFKLISKSLRKNAQLI